MRRVSHVGERADRSAIHCFHLLSLEHAASTKQTQLTDEHNSIHAHVRPLLYLDAHGDLRILRLVEPIRPVHLLDLLAQRAEHLLDESCGARAEWVSAVRCSNCWRAQRAPLSV